MDRVDALENVQIDIAMMRTPRISETHQDHCHRALCHPLCADSIVGFAGKVVGEYIPGGVRIGGMTRLR